MDLHVTHNAREVGRFVQTVFDRQLPFVTMKATNDSAIAGQKAQRQRQEEVFTIRRKRFVQNAVKIKPFATKLSLEARILIDPPGGQARASVLTQHESDPRKSPISGRSIAVPTEHTPRTRGGIVKLDFRPSRMRTVRARRRRGVFRRHDTLFQRQKDGSIRSIFQLVRTVRLDQRLKFVHTITRAVQDTYPAAFTRRFDQAIRTAR